MVSKASLFVLLHPNPLDLSPRCLISHCDWYLLVHREVRLCQNHHPADQWWWMGPNRAEICRYPGWHRSMYTRAQCRPGAVPVRVHVAGIGLTC